MAQPRVRTTPPLGALTRMQAVFWDCRADPVR